MYYAQVPVWRLGSQSVVPLDALVFLQTACVMISVESWETAVMI